MKTLMYKGKPLAREGRQIYYGNPTDRVMLFMNILEAVPAKDGIEIATKVSVQIIKTDDELSISERLVKQTEKNSLYQAFDIGTIWLERELNK
ncbi:MAG: hypothetical protein A2Y17_11915 [Clostridiales bacterium GWF2_38_85]|nr:MAG: hypothetical protein A2Y17_11915 [Clostridiales bacterium GWF2_38_85]HBL85408.1 hypothetical protein [Clostridiales bacterium]